jgi:hypothetical protein
VHCSSRKQCFRIRVVSHPIEWRKCDRILFQLIAFMRFNILLSIFAAAALLAGCSETPQFVGAAVDNDQNVLTGGPITGTTIEDLPAAVKQSLREHVPAAEIVSITRSRRDKSVVYDFSFANSDTRELYLRDDGKVLSEPMRAQK